MTTPRVGCRQLRITSRKLSPLRVVPQAVRDQSKRRQVLTSPAAALLCLVPPCQRDVTLSKLLRPVSPSCPSAPAPRTRSVTRSLNHNLPLLRKGRCHRVHHQPAARWFDPCRPTLPRPRSPAFSAPSPPASNTTASQSFRPPFRPVYEASEQPGRDLELLPRFRTRAESVRVLRSRTEFYQAVLVSLRWSRWGGRELICY